MNQMSSVRLKSIPVGGIKACREEGRVRVLQVKSVQVMRVNLKQELTLSLLVRLHPLT